MQFPRYYLMGDLLTRFWRVCIIQSKQKNIMNTKYIINIVILTEFTATFIDLDFCHLFTL